MALILAEAHDKEQINIAARCFCEVTNEGLKASNFVLPTNSLCCYKEQWSGEEQHPALGMGLILRELAKTTPWWLKARW